MMLGSRGEILLTGMACLAISSGMIALATWLQTQQVSPAETILIGVSLGFVALVGAIGLIERWMGRRDGRANQRWDEFYLSLVTHEAAEEENRE